MREVDIGFKWKWQKDNELYVLILYFNCEGKDPHIRTEKCHGEKQKYHTFSWSPRHPELGLIAHLLFYANILNGYKKSKKQSLRNKLHAFAGVPLENILREELDMDIRGFYQSEIFQDWVVRAIKNHNCAAFFHIPQKDC